jgi:hypothetical protein
MSLKLIFRAGIKIGYPSTLCLPLSYLATQVSLSTATTRMVNTDPVRQVWARGSSQGTRWGNTYNSIEHEDIANNLLVFLGLTRCSPK